MKINAINSQNYSKVKKQNKNNTSFEGRVQYYECIKDVISGQNVDLRLEPLRTLLAKIIPPLQRLEDDNLIITISGTQKKAGFFDIFSPNTPAQGLKFDLGYFDLKKFYNKFMSDPELPKFLDPDVLKGFQRKDEALMDTLYETVGVGKLYHPEYGETPEQYIAEVMPKIQEHLRIMPKLISVRKDIKYDEKLQKFVQTDALNNGKRKPWNYYRGLEFDYPPIGFNDMQQAV